MGSSGNGHVGEPLEGCPHWLAGGKQPTSRGGADRGQACALPPAGRVCSHAWDSLVKRLLSRLARRESVNEYPPEARC